jgi:hypothetical protein
LIITTESKDILTYITNYINFNITQQDTQRKLPDDEVHTPKHVAAIECVNKLSEKCNCWLIVHTEQKMHGIRVQIKKNVIDVSTSIFPIQVLTRICHCKFLSQGYYTGCLLYQAELVQAC